MSSSLWKERTKIDACVGLQTQPRTIQRKARQSPLPHMHIGTLAPGSHGERVLSNCSREEGVGLTATPSAYLSRQFPQI